jgi:hypothetical protein
VDSHKLLKGCCDAFEADGYGDQRDLYDAKPGAANSTPCTIQRNRGRRWLFRRDAACRGFCWSVVMACCPMAHPAVSR